MFGGFSLAVLLALKTFNTFFLFGAIKPSPCALLVYMKNLSIRLKITLIFAAALLIVSLVVLLVLSLVSGVVIRNMAQSQAAAGFDVSTQYLDERLSDITMTAVFLVPILTILASFLAYYMAGRMMSPIRRIRNLSSDIRDGSDLKRRMNFVGSNDEFHQLAGSIDKMMNRLEYAFEKESKLTSDVMDELRNPLTAIIAECEYMLDRERETSEYVDALGTILGQTGRMTDTMDGTLDYALLEQKLHKYPIGDMDYSSLVNEIGREMRMLADKDIDLQLDVEENIRIRGNRALQTCLIQNIIQNAYRFGKENGFIKVRLSEWEDKAILEIQDNGMGMDEESLEHIFDRFYRSNNDRANKGVGLGMSMVKRIVDMHNADIHVTSELNEGSCFRILFSRV